ncbi:GntR family transcriptional regulator [Aquamicrobium terrae]|uniref:DNA-binding GntR family transcriptional regulator n=1 Tax=Aquamicrobium terrae TaxID=1324945 RepID=A0ABV2N7L8_9HYPH
MRRPPSTVDAIVELLQDAIVRGDLPQGMPLRQERIAQKFGISKIPLREALAKLDAGGFVTTHPRRGVFVSEMSAEKIEEIFQLRLSIEPDLLRYAVPRMTAADMAAVEAIIEKFEAADTGDLGDINWELHRALYRASGRELSLQILGNLYLHVDRYVRLHMGMIDRQKDSNNDHRELLAACRRRDAEQAVQILHAHIDNIRLAIRRFVASDGEGSNGQPE